MTERFKDKVVVVTGAGQGFGEQFSKDFLAEGAKVAMLDIQADKVKETAARLDPTGASTLAGEIDVSDPDSVKKAFEKVYQEFGHVHVLVNNAGITRDAMFHKMTLDQWDQAVKVSLYGTFYCSKEVINGMRDQEYGRIINLQSMALAGNIGQTNYGAAKAGIGGLTKSLAKEVGRKNITVNGIAPGLMNTDIVKTVPEDILKQQIAAIPMQRMGEPEEASAAVLFLASEEAGYISGQTLFINGGLY